MSYRKALLLYTPSTAHLDFFKNHQTWEVQWTTDPTVAKELITDAEVVLGNHHLVQSLTHATKLQWLQVASAGMDFILAHLPHSLHGIRITNARGVYDDEMAEHTIALLLSLYRELHLIRDQQINATWQRSVQLRTLSTSKIMILGWGSLGKSISKKLSAFDCNIAVVSRTKPSFVPSGIQWISAVDWQSQLADVDALIIALPATSETKLLVNERVLNALPGRAFVINVGRAQVLDEYALFNMLQQNTIAGAALDVFNEEPLPIGHIAWTIPNLIISPHTARSKEAPPYKYERLFEENFMRYLLEKPLLNEINSIVGY